MIKAIIFDFGGVYFTEGFEIGIKKIAKKFRISYKKAYNIIKIKNTDNGGYSKGKISEKEMWQRSIKDLKISIMPNQLGKIVLKSFKPNKSVIRFAKNLRKSYKLALLTDQTNWLYTLNKYHSFFNNFDVKVVSCKVGFVKPQKQIYKILLKKLKIAPKECVFIDDNLINIKGAERLGMKGIVFKNLKQTQNQLKKIGVKWNH